MSFDQQTEPTAFIPRKFESCRICGMDADVGYVNQDDGLCQACRNIEEGIP